MGDTDPESDAEQFAAASDLFDEFDLPAEKNTRDASILDAMERLPVSAWDRTICMAWLRSLDIGVDCERVGEHVPNLSGRLLLGCVESVREMRDTFGLDTVEKRLLFEKELNKRRKVEGLAPEDRSANEV